jgi:tRNA (cmo5U34)-methyltransferase
MGQFHWDPDGYLEMVRAEVPDYDRIQDELALATDGIDARRVLELGTGSGVTSRRVLARHPHAHLTGVDSSEHMLAAADLPGADLRLQDLGDPLPEGPFDLVFSALAIHHLDLPEDVPDLLAWLQDAGLRGHVAWQARDLAVLVADAALSSTSAGQAAAS